MDQALKDALNQIMGSRAVLVLTQFAIGIGLMYLIDKFFKFVEEKLTDDTKLEIAVWLLEVRLGPTAEEDKAKLEFDAWLSKVQSIAKTYGPSVRLRLFWAVCGTSLSKKRMIVVSILAAANNFLSGVSIGHKYMGPLKFSVEVIHFAFSFVFMAAVLQANEELLSGTFGFRTLLKSALTIALAVLTGVIALVLWAGISFSRVVASLSLLPVVLQLFIVPALTVGVWMWLPAVSGFLLKAARRFDIGVDWFNRKFDIEKHPLQSIGLVAGALVAIVYWTAVIVSRVVG